MTSPVGHILGAMIVNRSWSLKPSALSVSPADCVGWRAGLFLTFAANAPDLDFLPGVIVGRFGAYHHGASHSLVAILLFTLLVYMFVRVLKVKVSSLWLLGAGLAYGSHILLDLFTGDKAFPYGMQLFWPFSPQYVIAPFSIFSPIHHGGATENLQASLPLLFSRHNLMAVGLEFVLLLPILWLSRILRKS